MRRTLLLACLGAVGLFPAAASADRLHLAEGGFVQASSWWIEDDVVYYRNARGVVGLPRSIVVRIEPDDTAAETPSAEPAAPVTPAARSSRQLPVDIVRRLSQAKKAMTDRDFRTAAEMYESLIQDTDVEFQTPRVGYALSQMALGEDDLALAAVLEGLAYGPSTPDLLELQGDLLNRQERVADAVDAWRTAFEHRPNDRLRGKILKGERELEAARDYTVTGSTHYNVRYDGEVDVDLASGVMEFLEEQYWVMADTFDHAPRQPITVVLYPKREFRDVTQTAEWVGGIYDGKIRVPLGGRRKLDPVTSGVLAHELTHAFVHSKTRGHCPRWLHEGLAQRSEGRRLSRKDRQHVLDRLREVDPADWETSGFSYPVALSLTSYLESYAGFHSLVQLLGVLAETEDTDRAFEEVYGDSLAELYRSWAVTVAEEYAP